MDFSQIEKELESIIGEQAGKDSPNAKAEKMANNPMGKLLALMFEADARSKTTITNIVAATMYQDVAPGGSRADQTVQLATKIEEIMLGAPYHVAVSAAILFVHICVSDQAEAGGIFRVIAAALAKHAQISIKATTALNDL